MQLHSTYLVISPPTVVSLCEDDGQSFAQIVYVRLSTMVVGMVVAPAAFARWIAHMYQSSAVSPLSLSSDLIIIAYLPCAVTLPT